MALSSRIDITCEPELRGVLDALAKQRKESLSVVVRTLLVTELSRRKATKAMLDEAYGLDASGSTDPGGAA